MAKKAKSKKGKGKSVARRSKGMMGDINLAKIGGIGAGLYGGSQLDKLIPAGWDPKFKAVAKIAIGELLPKQAFVKNMVKDQSLLTGIGDGVIAKGADELMKALALPGYSGLNDNDELVVVMDGDIDVVNKDIDVVNEDVLGEDDIDEDVLGEDIDDEDDDDGASDME